ncbi:MAG: HAMP domain-containing sensor histidine kinase [Flavobacteriales bacterium]
MKLLDRSLLHLSVALLLVLAVWSAAFFFVVRDAVIDSIDEGLGEQQEMILYRVEQDTTMLHVRDLGLTGFAIEPTNGKVKERYSDTLLYVPAEGKVEPVRLMTSGFEHDGQRYRLLVFTSTVEEDDLLENLFIALIVLYVVILLTIIVVHELVLRNVWKPFHAILSQLKEFRLGSGRRLKEVPTKVREFKELKAAADALVRHASDAYANQRAFTENAAHELQTPLAIAINKLELLAERTSSEEERMAVVGEVMALLERLTRLNRSLLLLARIENRQFNEAQDIAFASLVRDVLGEFADLAAHRQVELSMQVDGDLVVRMDPGLARILVTNLVKNAIVHNIAGGYVQIAVAASGLTVRNTGRPEPLDAARIFDRFHKETTADSGTGLGLPIVKAIEDLHGLRINYRYDGTHVITVGAV